MEVFSNDALMMRCKDGFFRASVSDNRHSKRKPELSRVALFSARMKDVNDPKSELFVFIEDESQSCFHKKWSNSFNKQRLLTRGQTRIYSTVAQG